MASTLPRALLGYGVSQTNALIGDLAHSISGARQQRTQYLEALKLKLVSAQEGVRLAEQAIAAEQEEQRACLATLTALAEQGQARIEAIRQKLAEQEFAQLADVTRREVLLGERRAFLQGVRDEMREIVERIYGELEGPAEMVAATSATAIVEMPKRAILSL